jgi:hypothetical protein
MGVFIFYVRSFFVFAFAVFDFVRKGTQFIFFDFIRGTGPRARRCFWTARRCFWTEMNPIGSVHLF